MSYPERDLDLDAEVQWVSDEVSRRFIIPPSHEQVFSDTLVCLKQLRHDVRRRWAWVDRDPDELFDALELDPPNDVDVSHDSRVKGQRMTDAALGEAVYMKLSTATDAALVKKLIPSESELIQMLHHAFTYDRDTTTLLVGDRNGNVLYGLIVTFHDGLLQAYGRVMDFMYEHGLSVFYSPDLDDLPMEEIETILRMTDKLKSRITMDDFMTSYLIWRQLCIEVDPSIVKFPIPSCDMLLPFIHAFWNSAKGGSDTIMATWVTWMTRTAPLLRR